MTAAGPIFDDDDLRQLERKGVAVAEAERQLGLFRDPPPKTRLDRPCRVGDGIHRLDPSQLAGLYSDHAEAARGGRLMKFVPASGAATRMFKPLQHFLHGAGSGQGWDEIRGAAADSDRRAKDLVTFVENLSSFPFFDELSACLARTGRDVEGLVRDGDVRGILTALLGEDGLALDRLPKGLLGFHRDVAGVRTPFEEHLVEAAETIRDGEGRCRLHFTVSPEHRAGFEALFRRVSARYSRLYDARFDVRYSAQKPFTDTVAVDAGNRPFRSPEGRLLFRPGGHGALIENLAALSGDIVYVKNIDNVAPDRLKEPTVRWKRALAGFLVRLQREVSEHLGRLKVAASRAGAVDAAARWCSERLLLPVAPEARANREALREALVSRLDRPLRVCGVVPNTGEPGGGPFWVRGVDGTVTPQIVETAQVDGADAGQREILGSATHFNPVDLVCAVRDASGEPYDLERFVDRDAVIISRKSEGGRDLKALERPGLWNGAMAGWNTVFVEVPLETFSPVKSILDLLRDEHRA